MKPVADILNHLLRQTPAAQHALQQQAGKTVAFTLVPVTVRLTIAVDGTFLPAASDAIIEATIKLTPSDALRLLAGEKPQQVVRLEGDSALAADVGKALQLLYWDIEEDLSKLIGDVAAHSLVSHAKEMAANGKAKATSLAEMAVEYWQEEQPLLAKRSQVDAFNRAVDTLRDDAERLAKRFDKLEQLLREKTS